MELFAHYSFILLPQLFTTNPKSKNTRMNYNYQHAMRAQRGYGQSARHREQPQWRIILFTFVMGLVVSVLISKLGSAKILGLTMLGWFFLIAIFLGLGMLPDLLDKSRHRREQRARADRQEQRARADRRDEIDRLAAYDRAGPALLRQLTDAGFTLADAKEAQKRSSTLAGWKRSLLMSVAGHVARRRDAGLWIGCVRWFPGLSSLLRSLILVILHAWL